MHETVKNEISIRGLTINKDNHKVTVYDEEVKLTPIEFDILYLLASNPGKVFSTDEIFEKVWNEKVYSKKKEARALAERRERRRQRLQRSGDEEEFERLLSEYKNKTRKK